MFENRHLLISGHRILHETARKSASTEIRVEIVFVDLRIYKAFLHTTKGNEWNPEENIDREGEI
eukprot:COSAG02_NODE_17732_length_984_cov_4.875706_1_plen_63_part_10